MRIKIEEKTSDGGVPEISCTEIKSGMIFYVAESRGVKGRGMRLLALTDAYYNGGHYEVVTLWLEGHPARDKTAHHLYDIFMFPIERENHIPADRVWVLGIVDDIKVSIGKMSKFEGSGT